VVAVSPLIILAYLKYFNDRRIVLVFLLMGLCGNIDLVSAMNLGLVTLLTFLACHKFNRQAVAVGISSMFLFIVGALPNISHLMLIHAHIAQAIGQAAPPDFQTLMQAFDMSYYEVTYPDLLVPLWQWGLYPLTLAAVSLVVLWRLDKFRSQFIDLWVWMSVSALIVMLVFHAIAMGLAAVFTQRVLPFYIFLQAACWLMLPLYVLFARALTQVFRMLEKKHRHILRWVMAGIMIGWMLPSDAFRQMRYGMYSAAAITPIGQNSLKINDIIERKARRRELANIAQWQRKNCVNSFVYIDSPKYRLNSGQSVLTCREDFIYYYLFAPAKLTQWMDNLQKDHALLATLSVPELVHDAISRTKTSPQISETFLVTSNKEVAANPQNLQEIKSDDWGKYWKIFRIPLKPVK
jgi:hypothetical protein